MVPLHLFKRLIKDICFIDSLRELPWINYTEQNFEKYGFMGNKKFPLTTGAIKNRF